jgi:hypothetical protein
MTDDPRDKFLTFDPPARMRRVKTAEATGARACYLRAVRLASLIAVSMLAACTETPSSFPPCVDPNAPCVAPEAGADASDAGVPDAATRAIPADAP